MSDFYFDRDMPAKAAPVPHVREWGEQVSSHKARSYELCWRDPAHNTKGANDQRYKARHARGFYKSKRKIFAV